MLVCCWSVKGGVGTTVVSAALALAQARAGREVLLVDLDGDQPAALGLPDTDGPGLDEWVAAGADVPVDGLARLETAAAPGVNVIPRGRTSLDGPDGGGDDRFATLASVLAAQGRTVVIDGGRLGQTRGTDVLAARATQSLLVTRACYLGLRRTAGLAIRPSGVVLVSEPGRALGRRDVEEVVGAPVRAEVAFDAAVARAVDAGLLISRFPRALERSLRDAT